MPDSDYSYEEYTIDVHTQRPSTPSTSSLSSSSITTVIAQNEDRTVNHQSQPNGRVSSWPPIPDEILRRDESPSSSISKESNSQSRPSRVQFAEQLIRVIPASATNSLTNESLPMTSVPPGRPVEEPSNAASRFVREQLPPLDHPPINQSRWVQDRMDRSETRNAVGRVGALRSVFEQPGNRSSDSSTVSSPTGHCPRQDPDEKPSKHGDEFRFRIEQANGTSMHHAEPVKVIQKPSNGTASVAPLTWEALLGIGQEHAVERTSPPFHLDQIRQIIGRPLTSLADAGHYLKVNNHGFVSSINRSLDCSRMVARGNGTRTFWLSLTPAQRDQLKSLEGKSNSRRNSIEHSLNHTDSDLSSALSNQHSRPAAESKRFTTTLNINTSRPQTVEKHVAALKTQIPTEKSSASSFVTSSQESIIQQQIITSSTRTNSQTTIIESGYNSGDEQQRLHQFRPQSKAIIEEPPVRSQRIKPAPVNVDPLSYGYFIDEYFTLYARHVRSDDGTLLLVVDEQEIAMPQIRLPTHEHFTLPKHIYSDAIDQAMDPFETETNELVIFLAGEPVEVPADRWSIYRKTYEKAPWIRQLKRVNRHIPPQLIPEIERWLAEHTRFSLEHHQVHVDGLVVPLLGSFGIHLAEISRMQPVDVNLWHDLLHYLIVWVMFRSMPMTK